MAAFNFAFYILLFSRLFLCAFSFSVFFCVCLFALFLFQNSIFYLAFCAVLLFISLLFRIFIISYLYRILFIRLSFIPHRYLKFSYPYFIYHEFTFFSLITDKTPLRFLRQKRLFAFVCSYRS